LNIFLSQPPLNRLPGTEWGLQESGGEVWNHQPRSKQRLNNRYWTSAGSRWGAGPGLSLGDGGRAWPRWLLDTGAHPQPARRGAEHTGRPRDKSASICKGWSGSAMAAGFH